jgi:hypothetical protein
VFNLLSAYCCFIPETSGMAPPVPGQPMLDSVGDCYRLGVVKENKGVVVNPDKAGRNKHGVEEVVRWRLEVDIEIISKPSAFILNSFEGTRGWLMFLPSFLNGKYIRIDESFDYVVLSVSPQTVYPVLIAGPIILNFNESYRYGGDNNTTQLKTTVLGATKNDLRFNAFYTI